MANNTNPENMLPIMIVLGIMFLGICIAMNLFSRARFKKRTNAFAAAGRTTPVRRLNRVPGSGCRLDSQRISYCPSPLPPPVVTTSNLPKGHVIEASSSNQKHKSSNRVSLVKI